MRYATKLFSAWAALMMLAACMGGGDKNKAPNSPRVSQAASIYNQVSDEPVTLGAPFTVGDVSYRPLDVQAYDDVGYAGYQSAESGPRQTANGEVFNPAGATAAHKTLPMPSYVEVTALGTGRTIVVRVNDRGPFANDRLIDLSEGAARQLGIFGQAYTGVRVRQVNPPEQERAVLREGRTAAERIETPETLLKVLRDKLAKLPQPVEIARTSAPTLTEELIDPSYLPLADGRFVREGREPATQGRAVPSGDMGTPRPYIVQIAAFSARSRADAFARKIGASVSASGDNARYRVYFGPYVNEVEAQQGLSRARQAGNAEARITRK